MTINEENFIDDLRNFLLSQGVVIEQSKDDGVYYTFKGPDIFLDLEDVYEEL